MPSEREIVQGIVSGALNDWHARLRTSEKGKLLQCWQNVYTFLGFHPAWSGVLALDTFAQRVVKRKPPPFERAAVGPWTPDDDAELGLWLAAQDGEDRFVVISKQTLIDGISASAMRHRFHPVREYLEACKPSAKPLIDCWTTRFLGARASRYTAAVGRYFLMNMVTRILEPGCIMRSVPVLEAAQERGKSTALHALAQPWFSDSHFELASKDAFEVIQGVWLYEISEMEQFSKAETTRVKQFISSREDNYRPPYERRAQRMPRQVCFGGTTNDRQYLRDWSGNTRFWPLRCEEEGEIRIEELAQARDGLFGEAFALCRARARRHPTREESAAHFEPEQEARRPEHLWMPMVAKWLNDPALVVRRNEVMVTEVLYEGLGIKPDRMTATMQRDVGLILTALGWEQARPGGHNGYRPRVYRRPAAVGGADAVGAPAIHVPSIIAPGDIDPSIGREPGEDDELLPL